MGKQSKDQNEVYFLVVYCEYFNKLRRQVGLKPKNDYHITIGFKFKDIHDISKGLDTIIEKYQNQYLFEQIKFYKEKCYTINNINILEYIEREYNYKDDKLVVLRLKNKINEEDCYYLIEKGYYIGYVFMYCIKKDINMIVKAYGCYNKEINKKYDKNNKILNYMIKIYNNYQLCNKIKQATFIFIYKDELILHEMPRNFSWVIPNKIGGISALRSEKDILGIKTLGISKIYYFLEKPYFDDIDSNGIQINYIHCINTKAPTIEDMKSVLDNETFEEPVLFGCLGGFGRTGTALACYLCKYNTDMSSEQVINYLKTIRPKSIENNEQMNFIRRFASCLYNETYNKIKTPIKLIILVGLPGSGKTTFSDLFLTSGLDVNIISQG